MKLTLAKIFKSRWFCYWWDDFIVSMIPTVFIAMCSGLLLIRKLSGLPMDEFFSFIRSMLGVSLILGFLFGGVGLLKAYVLRKGA